MNLFANKKCMFIISSIVAFEIGYRIYRKKYRKPKRTSNIDCYIEVLFFSGSYANDWRKHSRAECKNPQCYCHNFFKFICKINSAHKTLDICFYLITCQEVSRAIVRLHKKGVCVRVIADHDMSYSTGSQLKYFRQNGIQVRTKQLDCLMHHKFCIIDAGQPGGLVMTGSLNLTMQALAGNWDNLLLTTDPVFVMKFQNEFNRLWQYFT